mmetsp:Transcript_2017/g.4125  ORF Transcript_2017/g.4125 Transcript_2017/m.4125 type:complete len:328 (-) Transcript_2017:629-1612(-)
MSVTAILISLWTMATALMWSVELPDLAMRRFALVSSVALARIARSRTISTSFSRATRASALPLCASCRCFSSASRRLRLGCTFFISSSASSLRASRALISFEIAPASLKLREAAAAFLAFSSCGTRSVMPPHSLLRASIFSFTSSIRCCASWHACSVSASSICRFCSAATVSATSASTCRRRPSSVTSTTLTSCATWSSETTSSITRRPSTSASSLATTAASWRVVSVSRSAASRSQSAIERAIISSRSEMRCSCRSNLARTELILVSASSSSVARVALSAYLKSSWRLSSAISASTPMIFVSRVSLRAPTSLVCAAMAPSVCSISS